MLAVLFNSVLVAALLVVAGVFIRGAFKHTLDTTVFNKNGKPVKKPLGYCLLARKILWHFTVPVLKVGGLGLYFMALMGDNRNREIETRTDCYGNKWYKTSSGSWHTKSADPNAVRPHY